MTLMQVYNKGEQVVRQKGMKRTLVLQTNHVKEVIIVKAINTIKDKPLALH